jgi:hypothetical protein
MTAIEVLRAARELIATPDTWIQNAHSRVVAGRPCYCLFGAVDAVQPLLVSDAPAWKALKLIEPRPVHFNDSPTTTHADVLALLDAAIAAEATK